MRDLEEHIRIHRHHSACMIARYRILYSAEICATSVTKGCALHCLPARMAAQDLRCEMLSGDPGMGAPGHQRAQRQVAVRALAACWLCSAAHHHPTVQGRYERAPAGSGCCLWMRAGPASRTRVAELCWMSPAHASCVSDKPCAPRPPGRLHC